MFAGLEVVTPPAVEPLAIDLVRRHCRIDQPDDDDLLAMYLASARETVEGWLNRALVTQTLRYSVTNAPQPTAASLVPVSLIVFPLNWPPYGRKPLALPRAPVRSITSVSWGFPDDMQPAPEDRYIANLAVQPAQVTLYPSAVPSLPGQSVAIDYVAGYADDPEAIPMPIRTAILLQTAFMYESRGDVNAEMPDAVWRLLGPYRLWTFSG
jgi:hypothetical protein